MLVSAEALGLEQNLSSVGDLITAEEAEDMVGTSKTSNFEPLLMTKDMIEGLRQLGCFRDAKVKPPEGETIPKPKATNVVVFKDFFLYGLCFPMARFLR